MKTNRDELAQAEVTALGQRIAAMQKRKTVVNREMHTLRTRLATLQAEAEALATEHLQLLRKFDSVAALP